jgi:hypothetical protein
MASASSEGALTWTAKCLSKRSSSKVRTSSASNTEALLTMMSGGPMCSLTWPCNARTAFISVRSARNTFAEPPASRILPATASASSPLLLA